MAAELTSYNTPKFHSLHSVKSGESFFILKGNIVENILSSLKLDQYFKVILAVSFATLLLSLTVPLVISNSVVMMVSIGSLLIGLGEWCNSVPETTVTSQYRITVRNRQNTKLGNGLNLLGVIVIVVGIYFG